MRIEQIKVKAGRVFNHPYESFSNLRPEIELTATLEAGDDPIQATRELQAQAEQLVEDHKQNMLKSIHELETLSVRQKRMRQLSSQLKECQAEMDQIRKQYPDLQLTTSNDAH